MEESNNHHIKAQHERPWSWRVNRGKADVPWTDIPKYRSFIQLLLKNLREVGPNRHCADCGVKHRWATPLNIDNPDSQHVAFANAMLGVIICTECAKCHRQVLPHHISKVLYTFYDLDRWSFDDIVQITLWGNERAQSYWLAKYELRTAYPASVIRPDPSVMTRQEWITRKYVNRQWAMDTLPKIRKPYCPAELKVFSSLTKISWMPPPNINHLYLPSGFLVKTPSPNTLPFGSRRFNATHDHTNTSGSSMNLSPSNKLPVPSVMIQDVSATDTLPRISVKMQRRKRTPSLTKSISSWRENWMQTMSRSALSNHEKFGSDRGEGRDLIYSSQYSDGSYGTPINTEDRVKAWQTSALGNPEVTKFIEETFEFKDPTFSKPTGIFGPLIGNDVPDSKKTRAASLDLDVLASISSSPSSDVPKVQHISEAPTKLVQGILTLPSALEAAHVTKIPKDEPIKGPPPPVENHSSYPSNSPYLHLTKTEPGGNSVDCPLATLNVWPAPNGDARQVGHSPGSQAKLRAAQVCCGGFVPVKFTESPGLKDPPVFNLRGPRHGYVVEVPSYVAYQHSSPKPATTQPSDPSEENLQIISRKDPKDESKPASKQVLIEKAISVPTGLNEEQGTNQKDEGRSDESNSCNETATEEDILLLAELNAAFIETRYAHVSVDYRCLSDDEAEIDSESDKIEFEFGAQVISGTKDEPGMSVGWMEVNSDGATKDAAIRKTVDDPDLDEKIPQQERETQKPVSKPHPASLKSPRISFENYLAGHEPPILADLEKRGFQESSHVEQQTDNILKTPLPEQVQMAGRTSQLVAIHEDAESATDDPAVNYTPSFIPSIEDGLKTDDAEATPTADPQPLKDSSPFANMFKLNPQKAETDVEGEQKGSEKGASGGLIDFLIKSGLF